MANSHQSQIRAETKDLCVMLPSTMRFWWVVFPATRQPYTCVLVVGNLLPKIGGVLLWLLTAACIKAGRPQIAELVEQRLSKDGWPEYYDGKKGWYVGKQARKYQTWSISGYFVAKLMIENPSNLAMISLEDKKIEKPRLTRSASWPCAR